MDCSEWNFIGQAEAFPLHPLFSRSALHSACVSLTWARGPTNNRYATDEALRERNLANVNTQIGTQEKLDTTNLNLEKAASRSAYESQIVRSGNERLPRKKAPQMPDSN
jgi:hypothetical protein